MFPTIEDVAGVIAFVADHGNIGYNRLLVKMQDWKGTISRHGAEFVCGIHRFNVQGNNEVGYQVTMLIQRPEGWRQWIKVTDESYLAVKRAEKLGIPII